MSASLNTDKSLNTFNTDVTLQTKGSRKDAIVIHEQPLSQQDSITCRICLVEELRSKPSQTFIRACMCRDNLEFIHENCLTQWFNNILKERILAGQPFVPIYCQNCKQTIDLNYRQRICCRNRVQIKGVIKNYKGYFILCISAFIFMLSCLSGLVYLQKTTKSNTEQQEKKLKGVLIVGYIIVPLCLLFWIYKFITVYILYNLTYVAKIEPKRQIERKASGDESMERISCLKKLRRIREKIKVIRIQGGLEYR